MSRRIVSENENGTETGQTSWEISWTKIGIAFAGFLSFCLLLFVLWYALWVNYVYPNEMGFVFNRSTGQIEKLEHSGWVVRTPWFYDVHAIDLRPGQVCMNANQRVLNCKLVAFDPKGFDTFIEWHGPAAGNNGYIYEILKSYAFNVNNGKDCPFLEVRDEMRKSDNPTPETSSQKPLQ